jgi:hypothetical protein
VAEWTPFQTHYFSENLVEQGIEPGTYHRIGRSIILKRKYTNTGEKKGNHKRSNQFHFNEVIIHPSSFCLRLEIRGQLLSSETRLDN